MLVQRTRRNTQIRIPIPPCHSRYSLLNHSTMLWTQWKPTSSLWHRNTNTCWTHRLVASIHSMLTTYLGLSRCLYSSKITWEETEACNTHMNTPALNPVRTVQCFRKIYSEVSLHNMKLKEFWLILSVWDLPSTASDYLGMLSPPWQRGHQVTLPLCKVKHKFFKTALFIERLVLVFCLFLRGSAGHWEFRQRLNEMWKETGESSQVRRACCQQWSLGDSQWVWLSPAH